MQLRVSSPFQVGFALDALAQVEAAHQDWDSATQHFEGAMAQYNLIGDRHYAARSQKHWAAMLIAQGNFQEAIGLLKAALEVFLELGLAHEVTEAQELLHPAAA